MTIPGKPALRADALLVTQLHLGSSRAAELEARTSGREGKAEINEELATGPSTSRLVFRLRPAAEP